MTDPSANISIRPLEVDDLETLFAFQADPQSSHMAAFTAKNVTDRDAYMTKWHRLLADATVVSRTILLQESANDPMIVGSVATFLFGDERNVTYGVGRRYWGRGFATRGLQLLLAEVHDRPLFARAASDNFGSIRVLQKCGFCEIGRDRFFAEARGRETEETIFKLP
ncbi:MAG: GNAT family N-acetyltransferase [Phycisphaerales bacterium]|nr:GNAT family N-acetyltransferase [Phycisphaerales bacterium]